MVQSKLKAAIRKFEQIKRGFLVYEWLWWRKGRKLWFIAEI